MASETKFRAGVLPRILSPSDRNEAKWLLFGVRHDRPDQASPSEGLAVNPP